MNCKDKYTDLGNDYHWQWLRRGGKYIAWIANIFRHLPYRGEGLSVLDFGCGDGVPAWFLSNRGYEVSGYDILEEPLEVARQNVPDGIFSTTYPSMREFDYVIGIGVLEHMESSTLLVDSVMRAKEYSLVSITNLGAVDKWACKEYNPKSLAKLFEPCTIKMVVEDQGDSMYKIERPE